MTDTTAPPTTTIEHGFTHPTKFVVAEREMTPKQACLFLIEHSRAETACIFPCKSSELNRFISAIRVQMSRKRKLMEGIAKNKRVTLPIFTVRTVQVVESETRGMMLVTLWRQRGKRGQPLPSLQDIQDVDRLADEMLGDSL